MKNSGCQRANLRQAGTTYPGVVNLSRLPQNYINRSIRRAAYDAIPDYNPGTPVIEAVSKYSVQLNEKSILSIRFEDYFYPEMAAHGVTGISSITLNLCDGYIYEFEDLFLPDSDYQTVINQIIQEQIVAKEIPMLKPFEGVGPEEDYYLTPDSLVIYYQPAVYTPDYYGILEFIIPYSQIAGVIDPRGPIGPFVPNG